MIIEREHSDGYALFRIPGIIRTCKDSLIVYCECRKDSGDWAEIDIAMRKSTDGGQTWSERRILAYGNGHTLNNPVMFADKDVITLLYQYEYSKTFISRSYDDGETWSAPIDVSQMFVSGEYSYTCIACGPGHGTVMENGTYIVPVWMAKNLSDRKAHHPSVVTVAYSTDKGVLWRTGSVLGDGGIPLSRLNAEPGTGHSPDNMQPAQADAFIDLNETSLCEINGEILFNIRHCGNSKHRLLALSGGAAGEWHDVHAHSALSDPQCMGSMISGGGNIYFVNCDDKSERINLTLKVSRDQGRSWEKIKTVDSKGGYSDIALSADGKTAFIFYESFGDFKNSDKNLCFVKILLK